MPGGVWAQAREILLNPQVGGEKMLRRFRALVRDHRAIVASDSKTATTLNRRTTGAAVVMESVEGRFLFSTFTVSSTNDSGAGSLRQAILDANKTTAADTIKFTI